MPPKKRDKDVDGSKSVGRDQIQAEHELFLQAFEKPTQIYRYLRTRNMISPVFLHRTLSYMKHRMSRTHKRRSEFKVDNMLAEKMNKSRLDKIHGLGDYMTLMFLGFFDKTLEDTMCSDAVRVETTLLKISHKKRKDSSSAFMQVTIGTTDIRVNPMETNESGKIPAISIPSESFRPQGASQSQSYILLLRVETLPKINTITEEDEEPSSKRPKTNTKLFGSELVIFDKHNRCLLAEGEYELALQEIVSLAKNCSPKKHSTWEIISDDTSLEIFDKPDNPFEVFSKCPTLKFILKWTHEPSPSFVDRPKLTDKQSSEAMTNGEGDSEKDNVVISGLTHNNNSIATLRNGIKESAKHDEQIQIVYQFIYNNNSRQQTEPCDDMHCPWCSLDCITLYSLLKHLKLCHARFTFTYIPVTSGARIDVAINDMYDGSYTGSPHDLVGPAGCAFARAGPVRRTSVTNLLVCRPRKQKPNLSEFLELDENELNNQRPYITGHNRLYHHTETCLPVHPKELDIDSEGESDPLWLQHKTMQMIDEFTDVNEGEKELMKMWNLHVMKHGYVGDCQLPIACDMFLDMKGRELLQKNLYRNFVLHMCSLFDYGLVSPEVVYKTIQKLQSILSRYPEGRKVISQSRESQLEFWLKAGIHKQAQQEEKQKHHQQHSHQKLHEVKTTGVSSKESHANKEKHTGANSGGGGSEAKTKPNSSNADKDKSQVEKSKDSGKESSKGVNSESGNTSAGTSKRRTLNSQANEQNSNKRRLSQLRSKKDSPPRRRSAPSSDPPKNLPARRKSLAVLSGSAGSQTTNQIAMRKRLSMSVAKTEKH